MADIQSEKKRDGDEQKCQIRLFFAEKIFDLFLKKFLRKTFLRHFLQSRK